MEYFCFSFSSFTFSSIFAFLLFSSFASVSFFLCTFFYYHFFDIKLTIDSYLSLFCISDDVETMEVSDYDDDDDSLHDYTRIDENGVNNRVQILYALSGLGLCHERKKLYC